MTTGPRFREEHRLRDGARVVLRHIKPDDAAELAQRFQELSPESRRRRFLAGVSTLSDAQLRYLTHVDGRDHVAIVATTLDAAGGERGIGVARFVRVAGEPTVAEPAITVCDEYQRRGVGYLLGLTLARAARERGVHRFRGPVLEDNDEARQLLADLGARLQRKDDELVFEIDIDEDYERTGRGPGRARALLRAAVARLIGMRAAQPAP